MIKTKISSITLIFFVLFFASCSNTVSNQDSKSSEKQHSKRTENKATIKQTDTLYKPKSILDLFSKYDIYIKSQKKNIIKELSEDSLRRTDRWSSGLLDDFNYSLECKMGEDLEEKGIVANSADYHYLLLVCYHRYLNGHDIGLANEIKYYDGLQKESQKKYEELLKRDSVDGKYIPANLVDCFIELDKILSAWDKKNISDNSSSDLHMTLGMYLRNRWQLWGGSRLVKYFMDINGEMMHPDSMSGEILSQYELWLRGDKSAWREWEIKMRKENNSR